MTRYQDARQTAGRILRATAEEADRLAAEYARRYGLETIDAWDDLANASPERGTICIAST